MVSVVTADSPDAQKGRATEKTMTLYHDAFDQVIVIKMPIHDVLTGNNLTMKMRGTDEELAYRLRTTAGVMSEAGFKPGWRAEGTYGGLVDHLVVAREAVERSWLMYKARSVNPYARDDENSN
jgi:hypothetical protein